MYTLRFISTILGTATLFLLFGLTAPVRAQEEHPQDEHPQDARPAEGAPRDSAAKPSEDPKPREEAKPGEEARPKDEKTPRDENEARENRSRTDERTETRSQTETRTTVKHGPIENGRIPDTQFHAHFGRSHTFRVGHPVVVGGQNRFQYGGYWFAFGEPWPVGWSYNDEFYVDFIDGQYYLIDLTHPSVHLALAIVI